MLWRAALARGWLSILGLSFAAQCSPARRDSAPKPSATRPTPHFAVRPARSTVVGRPAPPPPTVHLEVPAEATTRCTPSGGTLVCQVGGLTLSDTGPWVYFTATTESQHLLLQSTAHRGDPTCELREGGRVVAADDDDAGWHNCRISVEVIPNARYEVRLMPSDSDDNGRGLGVVLLFDRALSARAATGLTSGLDALQDQPSALVRCPPVVHADTWVWGTDLYLGTSLLCDAAVHAGLFEAITGGLVGVERRPSVQQYVGSRRNGVLSREHGATELASFSVRAVTAPSAPIAGRVTVMEGVHAPIVQPARGGNLGAVVGAAGAVAAGTGAAVAGTTTTTIPALAVVGTQQGVALVPTAVTFTEVSVIGALGAGVAVAGLAYLGWRSVAAWARDYERSPEVQRMRRAYANDAQELLAFARVSCHDASMDSECFRRAFGDAATAIASSPARIDAITRVEGPFTPVQQRWREIWRSTGHDELAWGERLRSVASMPARARASCRSKLDLAHRALAARRLIDSTESLSDVEEVNLGRCLALFEVEEDYLASTWLREEWYEAWARAGLPRYGTDFRSRPWMSIPEADACRETERRCDSIFRCCTLYAWRGSLSCVCRGTPEYARYDGAREAAQRVTRRTREAAFRARERRREAEERQESSRRRAEERAAARERESGRREFLRSQ